MWSVDDIRLSSPKWLEGCAIILTVIADGSLLVPTIVGDGTLGSVGEVLQESVLLTLLDGGGRGTGKKRYRRGAHPFEKHISVAIDLLSCPFRWGLRTVILLGRLLSRFALYLSCRNSISASTVAVP